MIDNKTQRSHIDIATLDFGSGNFSSLDWYFSQIPLHKNMIYLFKITKSLVFNKEI